jgi:hypothetical protein
MKSIMLGKGRAASDQKPSPSFQMTNLERLSVLVGEANADGNRETTKLLQGLGVGYVARVDTLGSVLRALKERAFDLLLCAEEVGVDEGVVVLRAAREASPATRRVLMRARGGVAGPIPAGVEVIDFPASPSTLQSLLHRTAAAQGGFWCEVPELSLADVLSMYHQARRSITLLLSGPTAGRIHMEAGELVDADADGAHGTPALSRLLEAESGLIRTEALNADVERTIFAPFQSVLLEAAHRLDERRRDSKVGPSPPSRPPPPPFREPLPPERTSLTSEVPRASQIAMLQPLTPDPQLFFLPDRRLRRQKAAAAISVLASLLFVIAAAFYFKDRLDISTIGSPGDLSGEPLDRESSGKPASAVRSQAERALSTARDALTPTPAAPNAEASPPETSGEPQPSAAATTTTSDVAARAAGRTEPPRPSSFELRITSKPSRATVIEQGRALGKTPLTLAIPATSVANSPRVFSVHLPGHVPVEIVRGPSSSNVNVALILQPRPAAALDPDAGLFEDDLEPGPDSPRARRKDLGIRLRR